MSGGVCVVRYDGSAPGCTPDVRKVWRTKGFVVTSGEDTRVPATIAGLMLAHCPKGSLQIISGEPVTPEPHQPPWLKAAVRQAEEHRRMFPTDPAQVVANVPRLSAEATTLLRGPEDKAVLEIRRGKFSDELPLIAITARTLGLDKIVDAACAKAPADGLEAAAAKPDVKPDP